MCILREEVLLDRGGLKIQFFKKKGDVMLGMFIIQNNEEGTYFNMHFILLRN